MRWIAGATVLAIALCTQSVFAEEGNRGGDGPGSPESSPGDAMGPADVSDFDHDVDMHMRESGTDATTKRKKPWQVEGIWETHRLIRQNDLNGAAVNKTVNVGSLYGRYDITQYDRVWIRGGFYQRFLADETETGFRLDDVIASYVRRIPLPQKFTIRASFQASAPTSFASQKQGLITETRLVAAVEKKLDRFTFNFRTLGGLHFMKYATAEGGAANPKWLWVTSLGGEYNIPYVDILSVGMSATTAYRWSYQGYDAGQSSRESFGVTEDRNYPSQPVQQSYAFEIYARCDLPEFMDTRSDLTIAYAQGDPSLGYTSALHDGSRQVYPFFWRQTSTVYAALSVSY